jgi:hypothetical protein
MYRRRRAVQLPSAMVGDDERVRTAFGREVRVLGIHDAFKDELTSPELFDSLDVRPAQTLPPDD